MNTLIKSSYAAACFILLLSINFFSCAPSLTDLDLSQQPNKLVIWCTLHPDSVATSYVSKTGNPLSTFEEKSLNDAQVVLFENNQPVDTLFYEAKSRYASRKGFKPKENRIYKIIVSREGFATAETLPDTMPQKPIIRDFKYSRDVVEKQSNTQISMTLKTDFPKHNFPYQFENRPLVQDTFYWLDFSPRRWLCDVLCDLTPSDTYQAVYEIGCFSPSCINRYKTRFTIIAVTFSSYINETKINKLISEANIDNAVTNSADLFWVPPVLPELVKNGYGFLKCVNTLDVEFKL